MDEALRFGLRYNVDVLGNSMAVLSAMKVALYKY